MSRSVVTTVVTIEPASTAEDVVVVAGLKSPVAFHTKHSHSEFCAGRDDFDHHMLSRILAWAEKWPLDCEWPLECRQNL